MLLAEEDMSLFPNQRVCVVIMGTYLSSSFNTSYHVNFQYQWPCLITTAHPARLKLAVLRLPRKQVRAGHPNVLYFRLPPEPPHLCYTFFLSLTVVGNTTTHHLFEWMLKHASGHCNPKNLGQSWAYCCIFWQVCVFIKSCRMLATPFSLGSFNIIFIATID